MIPILSLPPSMLMAFFMGCNKRMSNHNRKGYSTLLGSLEYGWLNDATNMSPLKGFGGWLGYLFSIKISLLKELRNI